MTDHLLFLKNLNFLRSLSNADIQKIAAVCREIQMDEGKEIFAEGSLGRHFYIILKGAVEIWKSHGAPHQDLIVVSREGEAFGELALIDDVPRSATVITRTPATLLTIHRDDFHKVLKGSAVISFSMLQSLTAMVRERTDRFVDDLRERNRNLQEAYAQLKQEIEDRRQVQEQLHHQAFHDHLTGLPNRAHFLKRLDGIMAEAREKRRYNYAVLYMDIDRFSVINESFGHLAADRILKAAADRLKVCLRRSEVLARFSGDEFALLMEDLAEPEDAVRVAERVHRELSVPFIVRGKDVFVTVSIGIVPGIPQYVSTVDILRDADIAMYGAKALGQGQYQVYDKTLHEKTMSLLQLETDLRGAVERQEFLLKYQPIVALDTCRVAGFEALTRWRHPDRGMISPEVFIPIAERAGVILSLGRWILTEACTQMKAWMEKTPPGRDLFMNVNISAKQFMQPDFPRLLSEVLEETGLPGSLLKIELTESALIRNVDQLAALLDEIKGLGVRLAIDDFGTGYSSLSYLHRFPIDVLKIDRSFVFQMGGREEKDLVSIIVSIARNMKMKVVAEGIETFEQLRKLRDYGCEYGQGFLFSRPLVAACVPRLITGPEERMCLLSPPNKE
jgi:diguanylate cyclase (GGDEF)-like protein